MVGEVFIFWSKSHVSMFILPLNATTCSSSHMSRYVSCFVFFSSLLQNFKREEQNFVVMNEINNMSFLTADSKSKMSKVSQ